MKAIDRFYLFMTENNLKPSAVESEIGLSNGYLSAQKKRNADMGESIMNKIIDYYQEINPEWLLRGSGPMKREEKHAIIQHKENTVSIPIVEIGAAAGIQGYDNPTYIEYLDSIDLPTTMVGRNSTYFCIRVRGESMAPTLLDSGYLIVRLLNPGEWTDLHDNYIYVISTREGKSFVKRVKNRLRDKGFIVCMSDNPDKYAYSNFNIYEEELNSILYAEWYFTAKMPNIHNTYYRRVEELEDKYDTLNDKMELLLRGMKQVQ